MKSYFGLVPHGAFSAHHNLTTSLLLQLFGSHASRSQNTTDEVELRVVLHRHVQLLGHLLHLAHWLRQTHGVFRAQLEQLHSDSIDLCIIFNIKIN